MAKKLTAEQKVSKIAQAFEKRTRIRTCGENHWVSTHAYHNLGGAIITIEHNRGKVDKTTMRTLKRVERQLGRIGQALGL